MSGFEIVGVVLGSIPLLISGLEHYRNGIETIGSMVQYVEVVENILVSVSTTLSIYRQSCEVLLQGLFLPENTLDELLNDPSSAAWADEALAEQLRKQFGPHAEYQVYRRAVVRLNKRIEKLKSKLDLDGDFKPTWVKGNVVDDNLLDKFFNTGREIRRRIKIGFNGDKYIDLADAIESDVNRISTLIGGARTLEPMRADRDSKAAAKYWSRAGKCAQRLFMSLSSYWSRACSCDITHVASLPLNIVDMSDVQKCMGLNPRFEMLLSFDHDGGSTSSFPWQWKLLEIEPKTAPTSPFLVTKPDACALSNTSLLQKSKMPIISVQPPRNTMPIPQTSTKPTMNPILDLCDTLAQAADSSRCLGFIPDDTWEHFLHLVNPRKDLESRDGFSSLEDILCNSDSMGTKTKFRIAASLASAVLQFHATAWLNNTWDSTEIYFLKRCDKTIQTDRPYISKRFTQEPNIPPARRRDPSVSNEITFSLGVALIELSFCKRLLDFQEPGDLDENGNVDVLTKIEIAKRLVGKLESRDGGKYADVVDRCIRCRFDTRSTSLDDPDFLSLFYQGVIKPLEDIYNSI